MMVVSYKLLRYVVYFLLALTMFNIMFYATFTDVNTIQVPLLRLWKIQIPSGDKGVENEYNRLHRFHNEKTSRLSQFLVEKFEKALGNGNRHLFRGVINVSCGGFGNNLRGALSAILLCIFADCVPIISHGIGRNHKGHMLDFFSARDPRLQKYLRYENHDRDADWGSGGDLYGDSEEVFFESYDEGDPRIASIIDDTNPLKLHEVDGKNTHLCQGIICTFLQTKGNVEYENGIITKEIDTAEVFQGYLKSHTNHSAVVYRNNNFYLPHLLKDGTKTEILCDLGLCDRVEEFVFDAKHINRSESSVHPVVGYQYLGSVIGGNIFDDLFVLSPRLQPQFTQFVEENVVGFLLGIQIRSSWMGSSKMHSTPGWDQWVEGARKIIKEGEAASEREITIFISCDRDVPKKVIKSLYEIDGRIKRVLTKLDFPFDNLHKVVVNATFDEKQNSLESHMHTEEGVISTVFDFEMLGISDVTIITFVSSFGQFAGWSRSRLPSYVMFSYYQLPRKLQKKKPTQFMHRARISSYWIGAWWNSLDPFLDWLFNVDTLYGGV